MEKMSPMRKLYCDADTDTDTDTDAGQHHDDTVECH